MVRPRLLHDEFARRLARNRLARRDLLRLLGVSAAAPTLAALSGCATSPVTGETILVGLSEEQERAIDRRQSPHQFSQDLGPVQDSALNRYVASLGGRIDQHAHRQGMPYSYRVLNANYVNAYTFPAGSVGITRGIMTEMDNEAELAALIGHEVGHVNARHAAQRQGQAMVAQGALVGLGVALANSQTGGLAQGLAMVAGQVGASALLASYSRDNEREADALGQQYMTRAGYPASGMTQLHEMLVAKERERPSLLATMFSSHPMADERVATARRLAETTYRDSASRPVQRERYMDSIAGLRAIKPTINACQRGEELQARRELPKAEEQFRDAVERTPEDYASNVLLARNLVAQRRHVDAQRFASRARAIDPNEAQAVRVSAISRLGQREPAAAFADLDAFDRMLPGDPGITFLKGVSLEAGGDQRGAADHYRRYLSVVQQGEGAQYAQTRLRAWGGSR